MYMRAERSLYMKGYTIQYQKHICVMCVFFLPNYGILWPHNDDE